MEAGAAVGARSGAGRRPWDVVEVVGLAVLAYVPFLLSSPGRVSADTKQYLYLDPGRLLSRAPYLWDPHVAFGTVPHQQVGYLFPMGPYYWLMDAVGVPDWVAQRLWLGSISFAAALGARWLFTMLGTGRLGALAGALVYLLTPYQLAFTARLSVILLAWAALPWLVGLTTRAVREGGWRAPALFALVVLVVGSVNASSLVFVLIAPAVWLLLSALGGTDAARATVRAAARIALLSIGVSMWSAIGLRTQGAYGLPVLELTESVRTVARWSTPTDILRGVGNWIFYGRDALGFDLAQAPDYLRDDLVVFATFALPVLAFVAAGVTKWRHRAYFVTLVVAGTVIGVGAWPYDDPSLFGALFKVFANDTAAGLAMRNTARVVPLVVLGVAALLAAGIGALGPTRRRVAAGAVAVLAIVAFLPVWRVGYLSPRLDRPNDVPEYWTEAAAVMQRAGNDTRVLEIPGSNFSAYRWGDTIEPVTPGLVDRPFAAREVLPAGTPAGVNLLDALDHRLQEGTFEPGSLAPFARLVNAGTVVLRSDLEYERFNTPRPKVLWSQLTDPLVAGLEAPKVFGEALPNRPSARLPALDNIELRIPPGGEDPPPVALFDVEESVPIVHTAPSAQPVLLDGDGEGIVDAAAAGLLDGNQLVLEAAALDTRTLGRVLRDDADLLFTDSNRRRSQHYFGRIRDATGYTERAGETAPHGEDVFRLEPFPGTDDSSRTVVEQHGAQVGATDYAVTADRPANAFDGDPRTAWRVGGRVIGDRIVVRPDEPVRTDRVTLAQLPGTEDRAISGVRLHFDDGDVLDVALNDESRSPDGQLVTFPERTVRSLAVEIRDVDVPEVDPLPRVVGFTEIGLDDVRVRETVRLPMHLARAVGDRADGHRLDVLLSRLRYDPGQLQDEELALDRRFVLPDARGFGLSGTARINPNATDPLLDELLGTTAPGTEFTSADHLAGNLDARASRAFDGNPATAWTPNFGPQRGRWLDVSLPAPTTVDHVDLTVVVDGRHSVPTQLTLAADGEPVRSFTIPDLKDRERANATQTVSVPFDPVTGSEFRLYVDAVRPKLTRHVRDRPPVTAPVAIAEVGLAGVPKPASASTTALSAECRSDVLAVNGRDVAVRVVGSVDDVRTGLDLEPCGDAALDLPKGSNTVRSAPGLDTGIDVDRVVLTSAADGGPAAPTVLGAPLADSSATVRVAGSSPTSYDLRVRSDGAPFWLVLGQSASDGWEATTSSGRVGERQLVNGFANGWLVTPDGSGTLSLSLRWTPQRVVWIGFAVSALAIIACGALVAVTWRRRRDPAAVAARASLVDDPAGTSAFEYGGASPAPGALAALAVGAALATALCSRPWIGAVVGVVTLVAARVSRARILLTAGAPLALALARLTEFHDLAWLAVALLAADTVTWWVRARHRSRATEASTPARA